MSSRLASRESTQTWFNVVQVTCRRMRKVAGLIPQMIKRIAEPCWNDIANLPRTFLSSCRYLVVVEPFQIARLAWRGGFPLRLKQVLLSNLVAETSRARLTKESAWQKRSRRTLMAPRPVLPALARLWKRLALRGPSRYVVMCRRPGCRVVSKGI